MSESGSSQLFSQLVKPLLTLRHINKRGLRSEAILRHPASRHYCYEAQGIEIGLYCASAHMMACATITS